MSQRKGPKRWTGKAWVDSQPGGHVYSLMPNVPKWARGERVRVTITPLRPRARKGKR